MCLAGSLAWGAPVTLPYLEGFGLGAGSFTPAANGSSAWSVSSGKYRAAITAANVTAATTVENQQTSGGFRVSAVLQQVTSNHVDNSIGLGFLAGSITLAAGAATPYYLVDVKAGANTIRLIRIEAGNTFLINNVPLSFALDAADPFLLSVTGTYQGAALHLSIKVQQGEDLSTHTVTEATPLNGRFFGQRHRATGSSLIADCEEFSLTALSTVTLSGAPPAFARPGVPWMADLSGTSSAGGSLTYSIVSGPAWVSLATTGPTSARLSGTPAALDAGGVVVRVRVSDLNGTFVEKDYPISVISVNGVVISEFLAENDGSLLDVDGDSSDWLEVFNASSDSVSITGWGLSDDPAFPLKWVIPAGVGLPPFGLLRIFASSKNRTADPGQLHTNFQLSNNPGSFLSLARPDGSLASIWANLPLQKADVSYGLWGGYESRGYLLTPTPGSVNVGQGFIGFTSPVTVSLPRGAYQTAQTTTLTGATLGSTLVYTLDGSTPTLSNGTVIAPVDAAALPTTTLNVASTTILRGAAFLTNFVPSRVETRTYLFPSDIITQSSNGAPPAGWPAGPINGQVLDYGMDPDITGPAGNTVLLQALGSLPSFSLVTDRSHLLDPATGIYVNPYGREEAWERPVSVEMIQPDGAGAFQIDAGLRIRGGFSRTSSNPKHGFHLYFRSEYGETHLNYPLFGDEGVDRFDRFDLRCTQGGSWHHGNTATATYLKDEWCRATQGAMGQAYTRSRYVHLFLNGQYWGLHTTHERADNSFAASYAGGKNEDYDVIKTYVLPHRVEVADGDSLAWNALHQAALNGFTTDAAYFAVQGCGPTGSPDPLLKPLVDLESLIDYMILHQFTGNTDGPVNPNANVPKNFYGFRPRDGKTGFRFVAHDCEDTMTSTTTDVTGPTTVGTTLTYFNPRWLHQQLSANSRYRLRFADRVQRHLYHGGALDTVTAVGRWTALRGVIAPAMIAESARWGDAKRALPYTVTDWTTASNNIVNSWFPGRRTPYLNQLRSRGLLPTVEAPAFNQHGGRVPAGFSLTLSGPAGSELFYSLGDADPSEAGAIFYQGPVPLAAAVTRVKARAKNAVSGEWSALSEALFTLDALPALAGRLAISEVHYNPLGTADDEEFMELVNLTSSRLDLSGVTLTNAVIFQFPAMVLEPGQRVILVENELFFRFVYGAAPLVAGQWSGALNNTGDTIVVLDAAGGEIDRLSYADSFPWPTEADGAGRSLVRIRPGLNAQAAWNWRAGSVGGQPGATKAQTLTNWLEAGGFAHPLAEAPQGVTALMRYAMGLDLGGEAQPVLKLEPSGATAVLTLTRRLGAVDAVDFIVEFAADGLTWQTLNLDTESSFSNVTSRSLTPNGRERLTVILPENGPRLLARVKVQVRN